MPVALLPLTFFASALVEARLFASSAALRPVTSAISDADLANSFEVVRTTRTLPFDWKLVLRLAVLVAVPPLP